MAGRAPPSSTFVSKTEAFIHKVTETQVCHVCVFSQLQVCVGRLF